MTQTENQIESDAVLRLDAFIESHYPRLLGLLVLKTGDRQEAEDLAQEAMIKLVSSWNEVSQMANPWGWLATVAVNSSTSFWRRAFRGRAAVARLDTADRADDALGGVELLHVVAALPTRQRTALVLRHYAQLSVRETAGAMDCAEGGGDDTAADHRARIEAEVNDLDSRMRAAVTPDEVESVGGDVSCAFRRPS